MKKLNLCAMLEDGEMFVEELSDEEFNLDYQEFYEEESFDEEFNLDYREFYEEGLHIEVNKDNIKDVLCAQLDEMERFMGEDYDNEVVLEFWIKVIDKLEVKKLVVWGIEYDMNITAEYE